MWTNFMVWATNAIADLRNEDEGQTLVEYALIIALVSVLLIGALAALRGGISGAFDDAISALGG